MKQDKQVLISRVMDFVDSSLLFTPQPKNGCAVKSNGIQSIENSPLAKDWMPSRLNLHVLTTFAAECKGLGVKSNDSSACFLYWRKIIMGISI
ncbi:MAG: hypothetical protein K2N87_07400 [Eubacterium sp.]|nr:hypothetical protein [Eubacterium sp.]